MSRNALAFIIVLSCVALFASIWAGESQWAGESEDVPKIRDVFYKEVEAWRKGDPEQIMAGYAPGFVGYSAFGRGPEDWFVWIVGLDSLRTQYAARSIADAAQWAEHPDRTQGAEVRDVAVNGD